MIHLGRQSPELHCQSFAKLGVSSCRTCFGYLEDIDNYIRINCGYDTYSDNTFPARFPWEVKRDIFTPLVAYIVQLSKDTHTYHHYIYDLIYLNAVFDYRYIGTHYSFSYALVEYKHMMDRLHYIDTLFNADFIHSQIQLLTTELELEITRARTGHFYGPCSCGSSIMSSEEFAKKTSQ